MYHLTGGVCADINLTGKNKRRANYLFDLLHSLVKTKLVILNAGNMGDSKVENKILYIFHNIEIENYKKNFDIKLESFNLFKVLIEEELKKAYCHTTLTLSFVSKKFII